ncbi:MAG: protein kinase [Planctomycetes bacterium]|nr:protein kinase [Planctomycetota bacterium]
MVHQHEQRNPIEVLAEQFILRRRRGEGQTVDEYASTHPELADEIRRLFPAIIAMEQVKTFVVESGDRPIELRVDKLEQLGDYRILREIGRGGMGIVYEAEQQSLGRLVAVKVFPQQVLGDSRQLQRFRREARVAALLHHTNIVQVFGVGDQDGLSYYVM